VDEHRLAELFQDAVRDAPPASFNEHDVLTASTRARARQRTRIATGAALAIVLIAGGSTGAVALFGDGQRGAETNVASAPGEAEPGGGKLGPYGSPAPGALDPPAGSLAPQLDVPAESPKQGGAPLGKTGPSANGCGQADRELADALAGELPAVAITSGPHPAMVACPAGSHGASYEVADGASRGVLTIMLVPRDVLATPSVAGGHGVASAPRAAPSGGALILVSQPRDASTPAPFAADLERLSAELAPRF